MYKPFFIYFFIFLTCFEFLVYIGMKPVFDGDLKSLLDDFESERSRPILKTVTDLGLPLWR